MDQLNTEASNIQPNNEISIKLLILEIKNVWRSLLFKWKTFLVIGILSGSLGVIYSVLKKPIYSAVLSFALEDDNANAGLGGAIGLASQFGFDIGGGGSGGAFSGDNLLQLMKSRSMVEKTLLTSIKVQAKEETLANVFINFNNLREKWEDNPKERNITFLPNADRSKFTLAQDSVLGVIYRKIIKANLSVDKIDKKLSIITVKVNSENEYFSKYFAEVLVKTVSDFYIQTKTKRSTQNVNILQHQTDSVRNQLNAALTGVASSVDNNPNPNPTLQILRVPSQKRQVDVQANQAILSQLVANLEISKVSLRKETPLVQIIDKPILPLEKFKTTIIMGFIIGVVTGVLSAMIIIIVSKAYKKIMA
jgi:hypothetical protein